MKESNIKELVYLMKKNRDKKLSSPIFFLGAGASRTGKIPLSDEIIKDILIKYKDNPRVVNLKDEEKTYVNLMDCLLPIERNELLKEYIEKAKINVTHIYLAQLIKNDYVDYVLTVNFDNLMLRALALFNIFPPTYDMAVLKELTTTTITRKSIVYLHGQHHGLWLLNTQEEMDKVETVVPKILHSIKDRPWIFIGYSGSDPIFDQIAELGRFDKGLFWVTNLNNEPNKCICDKLLNKDNANCSLIKGYDSDSFMLELNASLKLKQPQILEKPFTSLKNNLNEIVDIDEKEHYKGVKERIEIAKKQVEKAISQFEDAKETNNVMTKEETKLDLLKKQIIANLIKKDFNENKMIELEKQVRKLNDNESKIMMSDLYQNSADSFLEKAMIKGDEKLYHESIKKYKKALELHPNNAGAYNNWGAALAGLASLKGDEKLYHESLDVLQKAEKIDGKKYNLACLYAKTKNIPEALKLLELSLKNGEIKVEYVKKDEDWNYLKDNMLFNQIIDKYK
jgi:tetratricopeptide (TPR) repeat protein